MKLNVRIGNVFSGDLYTGDTYFETDEEYTEEIKDGTTEEEVREKLLKEYNEIYTLYETKKGFCACVI